MLVFAEGERFCGFLFQGEPGRGEVVETDDITGADLYVFLSLKRFRGAWTGATLKRNSLFLDRFYIVFVLFIKFYVCIENLKKT